MTNAAIHSVETFGTVDGPGTRLVVFLSECHLGCAFCHNPDTWQPSQQLMSPKEILDIYRRYRSFYKKGGITFSGGEPLLQSSFLMEILQECRQENIHTIIDTAGFAPKQNLEAVLPWVDQFIFSIKTLNPILHRKLTLQNNQLILENLQLIIQSQAQLILRYVLIPTITDQPEDLLLLKEFLAKISRSYSFELLPFHQLGRSKWKDLNWDYSLETIPAGTATDLKTVEEFLK